MGEAEERTPEVVTVPQWEVFFEALRAAGYFAEGSGAVGEAGSEVQRQVDAARARFKKANATLRARRVLLNPRERLKEIFARPLPSVSQDAPRGFNGSATESTGGAPAAGDSFSASGALPRAGAFVATFAPGLMQDDDERWLQTGAEDLMEEVDRREEELAEHEERPGEGGEGADEVSGGAREGGSARRAGEGEGEGDVVMEEEADGEKHEAGADVAAMDADVAGASSKAKRVVRKGRGAGAGAGGSGKAIAGGVKSAEERRREEAAAQELYEKVKQFFGRESGIEGAETGTEAGEGRQRGAGSGGARVSESDKEKGKGKGKGPEIVEEGESRESEGGGAKDLRKEVRRAQREFAFGEKEGEQQRLVMDKQHLREFEKFMDEFEQVLGEYDEEDLLGKPRTGGVDSPSSGFHVLKCTHSEG